MSFFLCRSIGCVIIYFNFFSLKGINDDDDDDCISSKCLDSGENNNDAKSANSFLLIPFLSIFISSSLLLKLYL